MKRILLLFMVLLSFVAISSPVLGANAIDRLMGNDQDLLILGEVIKVTNNKAVVTTHKQIISTNPLKVSTKPINIMPQEVTVHKLKYSYGTNDNNYAIPKVGDKVLLSLIKNDDETYHKAWGAYKVNNTNYLTATILNPPGYNKSSELMEHAAITYFINSDGKINNFTYGPNNESLYYYSNNDNKVIIYQQDQNITDSTSINNMPLTDNIKQPHMLGITVAGIGIVVALFLLGFSLLTKSR